MLYGVLLGALMPPAVIGLVAAFTSVGMWLRADAIGLPIGASAFMLVALIALVIAYAAGWRP